MKLLLEYESYFFTIISESRWSFVPWKWIWFLNIPYYIWCCVENMSNWRINMVISIVGQKRSKSINKWNQILWEIHKLPWKARPKEKFQKLLNSSKYLKRFYSFTHSDIYAWVTYLFKMCCCFIENYICLTFCPFLLRIVRYSFMSYMWKYYIHVFLFFALNKMNASFLVRQ